jgi:hypothetical protein
MRSYFPSLPLAVERFDQRSVDRVSKWRGEARRSASTHPVIASLDHPLYDFVAEREKKISPFRGLGSMR